MPIAVCACKCGSTDQAARLFLEKVGYPDWATFPVPQGKEASRRLVERLPQSEATAELDHYLESASKWIIIIGWSNGSGECRWADIAHNQNKSKIDAEFVIKAFANIP